MFHAKYLRPQILTAERGKAVGLFAAGGIVILVTLDPAIVEQSP
ncbi:MAG TPA: hypothetical protein VKW78_00325 [Terriglobales bacterium]|nr:hypothetical protein [Terriglobales bacterium]